MTAVLAIVAALVLSTILQPATAIAGAFCMYGLEQWAQASQPYFATPAGRAVINYSIGCIVVLGLAIKIYRGHPVLRGYPLVGVLAFALFFFALASTLWAPNPPRSLSVFLGNAPYIITIVFLCPLLCSSIADFERMLVATFVLGTVMVCLLMFTVEWEGRSTVVPEYAKLSGNPLATGQLGGTIAIIAAFLSWGRLKLFNVLKWIVVGLGLLLAVRSGSRGQTIATIMAIFACWPIAYRLHGFKASAILGCAIIVMVGATLWGLDAYWADSERWSEDALEGAGDTRLNSADRIFDYWFTTPAAIIFGLGSSAYGDLFGGSYSHVVPMEILTEEGILGFMIYVGILWTCVKNGINGFSLARHNPVQRSQLAILCGIFVYYSLLSLKQGSMLGCTPFFMVAILMGKYQMALSRERLVRVAGRNRSNAATTNLG